MTCQMGFQNLSEIRLRTTRRRTIVIGKIEMTNTRVECTKNHLSGNIEVIDIAEIVPQSQRKQRQLHTAMSTKLVFHPL